MLVPFIGARLGAAEHVLLLDQAAPISVIQWIEFARSKTSLHRK